MSYALTNPVDRAVATATAPALSRTRLWGGRVLTALSASFLLFDAALKVLQAAPAVQGSVQLGYPAASVLPIGVVLLVCTVLYLIPRTAILGAVLITGYLGGAIATHVRVGNPLFSHTLFPIYVAVLVWGALYLRDRRLRGWI